MINRTCEAGKVGYKSRTCKETKWDDVFSACISEQLNKVSNAADVSMALQDIRFNLNFLFLFLFSFYQKLVIHMAIF